MYFVPGYFLFVCFLSFMDLVFGFLQFWEIFGHNFLRYILGLSLSFLLKVLITHMVGFLVLSHGSLISFLPPFFFFLDIIPSEIDSGKI